MSLFDLFDAVAELGSDQITVTTFNTDSYDAHGKVQARTVASTVTMLASVQPASVKLDREDARGVNDRANTVNVWAQGPLKLRQEFQIVGRESEGVYEIESVELWNQNGNFTKATARQKNIPFEVPIP